MNLKNRLANGDTLIGTILSMPSPETSELMALAGFDWLFIDLEHGPMGFLEAQRMIQATQGKCASLVRVPENTEVAMKKALDIGAEGIIAPRVNTAEEAASIVAYSKYAPDGQRGVGATRAHGYGIQFQEYVENANAQTLVVVQIEHIEGVNQIDSIVAVEGVDVIFVGPYDLSASMGLIGEVAHPDVLAAIEKVGKACKEVDKPMGFFGMTAEAVQPAMDKGYQLITCGTDTGFLAAGAQAILSALK